MKLEIRNSRLEIRTKSESRNQFGLKAGRGTLCTLPAERPKHLANCGTRGTARPACIRQSPMPPSNLRFQISDFRFRSSNFPRVRLLGFLLMSLFTAYAAAPNPITDSAGDVIECANLIYAGTKSSVCFSEEFLTAVAADTSIKTSRKFKPVKLAEAEVFHYPFVVMTGEGSFTLTDEERKNLKAYLEKGGFLLASAGCSSKEWSSSFEREMAQIFPDGKLEPLGKEHPVFHTVHDIERLQTKAADAQLRGLTLGGKTVVIYSPDGLNDTMTMHGCCCCGGNEIQNARQVNANILAYALLQ